MELIKNELKIKTVHEFMLALEAKDHKLSKAEIYKLYESTLKSIEPIDIFYLPKYQEDTTQSIEEIKASAGKFVNAFAHGLEAHQPLVYNSNLFTYMLEENKLIEAYLNQIKPLFKKSTLVNYKDDIHHSLLACLSFEQKFVKREMILFPILEQRLPSKKPLEVLWSLHDDARVKLKELLKLLKEDKPDSSKLAVWIGLYYNLIFGINRNERLILFPVADQFLNKEEKIRLFEESKIYGYVFINDLPKSISEKTVEGLVDGQIMTRTGHLSLVQFKAIMKFIPLDITFVDKDDRVSYFNDRVQRHFPRNPSIIGRLVKNCHPPKSVHIVEKIVESFKNGEKDMAEFWLQFKASFIYITYYAVRTNNGEYLGTLEVSQDVTHIRELKGEQRIIDWE